MGAQSLTEQERHSLRELALRDTFFFTKVVLGYGEHCQEEPHRELLDFLDMTDWTRRLILCPRGTHKSFLGRGWAIQQAMRNPNVRILYAMSSEDQAIAAGSHIDGLIRNAPLLSYLFPDRIPQQFKDQRWNKTEMTILRPMEYPEPTFRLVGVGTKLVGSHFDIVVLDDFIEQAAADSDEVMDKAIRWAGNIEPTLVDRTSQLVVIGTRWSLKDYYGRLMGHSKQLTTERLFRAEGDRKYWCYKAGAINNDGTAYFPSKLTLQDLTEKKESLRSQGQDSMFYFWYMNNPVDEENCAFKRDWIRYWTWMDSDPNKILLHQPKESPIIVDARHLRLTMTVDPAFGTKKHHDKSAMVVVGSHPKGYRINLYSWTGRVEANQLVDKIFKVCRGYANAGNPLMTVAIERVQGQDVLNYWIDEKQRRDRFYIPLKRDLKTSTHASKEARIRNFIPFVANGTWYTHRQFLEENTEMETFPNGQHVNWLDALAYQPQVWGFPEVAEEKPQWTEGQWDEDEGFKEPEGPPVVGYGG